MPAPHGNYPPPNNSKLFLYESLGANIVNSWGVSSRVDRVDTIKGLNDKSKTLCVLAAIHRQLQNIHIELWKQRKPVKTAAAESEHPVADGMLQWMTGNVDIPIDRMDQSKLGPRARDALRYSGIKFRSQITPDAFTGIPNCGKITINELMKWSSL